MFQSYQFTFFFAMPVDYFKRVTMNWLIPRHGMTWNYISRCSPVRSCSCERKYLFDSVNGISYDALRSASEIATQFGMCAGFLPCVLFYENCNQKSDTQGLPSGQLRWNGWPYAACTKKRLGAVMRHNLPWFENWLISLGIIISFICCGVISA